MLDFVCAFVCVFVYEVVFVSVFVFTRVCAFVFVFSLIISISIVGLSKSYSISFGVSIAHLANQTRIKAADRPSSNL